MCSMNFASRNTTASKARSAATSKVVGWIQKRIGIYEFEDDSIQVMVTELECNDPECVPLETLVALLGRDARWTTKVLKPLNEVTQQDIEEFQLPSSWLSWVAEQVFIKSNPEIYSWMTSIAKEIEAKFSDLPGQNSSQATKIMSRLLSEMQFAAAETDVNISDTPDTVLSMKDTAPSTVTSTVVPMRSKNVSEGVPLLTSGGDTITNSSTSVSRMTEIDFVDGEAVHLSGITVSMRSNQKPTEVDVTSRTSMVSIVDGVEPSKKQSPEVKKTVKLEVTRNRLPLISSTTVDSGLQKRHKKGTRPRGCPCCDPSNVDNIIDKMIFLETPP